MADALKHLEKQMEYLKQKIVAKTADLTDPAKPADEKAPIKNSIAEDTMKLAELMAKKAALGVKGGATDMNSKLKQLLVKGIHQASKFLKSLDEKGGTITDMDVEAAMKSIKAI